MMLTIHIHWATMKSLLLVRLFENMFGPEVEFVVVVVVVAGVVEVFVVAAGVVVVVFTTGAGVVVAGGALSLVSNKIMSPARYPPNFFIFIIFPLEPLTMTEKLIAVRLPLV